MKKFLFFTLLFLFQNFYSQDKKIDSLLALTKISSLEKQAELYNSISDSYKNYDVEKMQGFAKKALQISTAKKLKIEEAIANQNMGVSQIILGNYDQAISYFDKSEKILLTLEKNKKNQETLAKNYGSKGIVFSEQNQYAKALDNDFKAVKI